MPRGRPRRERPIPTDQGAPPPVPPEASPGGVLEAKAARLRSGGRCVMIACEDAQGNVRLRPWRCNPGEVARLRTKLDEAGMVFDKQDFEAGEE